MALVRESAEPLVHYADLDGRPHLFLLEAFQRSFPNPLQPCRPEIFMFKYITPTSRATVTSAGGTHRLLDPAGASSGLTSRTLGML